MNQITELLQDRYFIHWMTIILGVTLGLTIYPIGLVLINKIREARMPSIRRKKYFFIDEQVQKLEKEFPHNAIVVYFDYDLNTHQNVLRKAVVHHYAVLSSDYMLQVQVALLDRGVYEYRDIDHLRRAAGEQRRNDARKDT